MEGFMVIRYHLSVMLLHHKSSLHGTTLVQKWRKNSKKNLIIIDQKLKFLSLLMLNLH